MSNIVKKHYGREYTRSFKEGIRREWVITNGLGGYAAGSLIGANTRKHHGLLAAALNVPCDRFIILNRIDEKLTINDRTVGFSSVQRKNAHYEEGYIYQTDFSFDCVPEFTYLINGVCIKKTIALEWKKNTVAVLYEIVNQGDDCILSLSPVFNFRDHNDGSKKRDLKFDTFCMKDGLMLEPKNAKEELIRFFASDGILVPTDYEELYDEKIELQTEIDTGMSSSDTGYKPYQLQVAIKAREKKTVSLVCTIEYDFEKDAKITVEKAKERAEKLIEKAGFSDETVRRLVVNADNFICDRESTHNKTILAGLPWFADWGRDTMIAFTGLTLVTKRFDDAKSILKTFTEYEKNGILPNMFPDGEKEPLYNTADASLWFFFCVDKYLEYVGTKEAKDFIKETIYPCLKKIQKSYETGTDFSIHMCEDGLIHAGSDLDQVTWMDVRVGDYVVTPRHGKPVEINALWYNAVKVLEKLAVEYGDKETESEMSKLSERIKESFVKRFWNENTGCLFDVVDEIKRDGKTIADNDCIRPNQIYAVSLPYTMLDEKKAKSIVDIVLKKLYIDFGLRTLPEDDPDYHGIYFGPLHDRDMAYHQGTAWAFFMGGFITAYLKVNDYSDEAKEYARILLEPMRRHLDDGCIGGIAEIFDADAPYISRGCHTQAWSVGETIRAFSELVK